VGILCKDEHRLPLLLHAILGAGLGLSISACSVFLNLLIFGQFVASFVITVNALLLITCVVLFVLKKKKEKTPWFSFNRYDLWDFLAFGVLIGVSAVLWIHSHFYAYGGWDAWTTWNFKAKLIYLGKDHWHNIFLPTLWRSSPHYPLLLPLTNVWGWTFLSEPLYKTNVFTSYIYSLLINGLMFASLRQLTKSYISLLPSIVLLSLPTFVKLSLSQYGDHFLGYYLLASITCLIIGKTENKSSFLFLAGLFIGFLSFTKSEGLIAAFLCLMLSIPYLFLSNNKDDKIKNIKTIFTAAAISFIPTLIFKIIYSPGNQTFINGLFSSEQPVTLIRIKTIFSFYIIELAAPLWNVMAHLKIGFITVVMEAKWNGLWLLFIVFLLFCIKKCFNKNTIILPTFLFCYAGIITVYYFINTHFNIEWWLQVSLSRILFAVLPLTFFWVFYALWQE